MKKLGVGLVLALFLTGCTLSDEDKSAREQILKQQVDSFTNDAVQGDWNGLEQLSDGSSGDAGELQKRLQSTWVDGGALTGADIASMAWVNDKTAKVKVNWGFRSQGVQSYSCETFLWVWKDGTWKYRGRAIR